VRGLASESDLGALRMWPRAAVLADGKGPWPHGPVDVLRLHAKPNLRELFDWFAVDGRLDGSGLTRLLQAQRESDGLREEISDAFSRMLQATVFRLKTNASLGWEDFRITYQHSYFPLRKNRFTKFAAWSCLKVRRQTLPKDSYHYRYLPKMEARFLAAVGRTMVEWCNDHVRHRRKPKPQTPPPPPTGGYREESQILSFTAMLAQGCKASEATLRCSFPRKAGQRGRLAVLVTGIKNRYYPRSAFKHVVAPAAREGYEVDYFALLDWKSAITTDRITGQAVGVFNPLHANNKREARSLPNPQFANASVRQGLSLVSRLARASGASSLYLQFLDPGLQEDPPRQGCNRYLGQGSAEVMNYRRTRLTYKNVEILWNITLERLKRQGLAAYNHVLWQREDAHWVSDLRLDLFRDPWTVSGFSMSGACEAAPSILPEGHISDKVFLAGEVAASSFFKLYDLVNCGNPNPELSRVRHPEHFIVEATRALGLKFQVAQRDREIQNQAPHREVQAFLCCFRRFGLFQVMRLHLECTCWRLLTLRASMLSCGLLWHAFCLWLEVSRGFVNTHRRLSMFIRKVRPGFTTSQKLGTRNAHPAPAYLPAIPALRIY
ncbi:unnamed protein product, partial [Symbiodinium necroappetens]